MKKCYQESLLRFQTEKEREKYIEKVCQSEKYSVQDYWSEDDCHYLIIVKREFEIDL